MAATETEIKIDLDAIDADKAKKAADAAAKGGKTDDTPVIEVAKVVETPKVDDKIVLTPDEGLEKLKKQLETERNARADAERRAQESSDSELRARTEVQDTNLNLLTTAIASVKQSNENLKAGYAEALAAQDYPKVAELQLEMSNNAAKLLQLENGKTALERAPKPTPRPIADPVEQFAARLTPQSAAWVRAHPDYVRDAKKNREMLAAHEIAIARGNAPDSPGYFTSIEKTLDIAGDASANGAHTHVEVDTTGADDPTAQAAKPAAVQRRAPPAAAPVTRSGNGAGNRRNVVTLTPAEVEIASMMQMSPEEYARNKVALQKDGKLN